MPFIPGGAGVAIKTARAADNIVDSAKAIRNKPDFIVSPNGTAMPTNKDFNLVDSNKNGGDWFQIHNNHSDAKAPGLSHTHYPKSHNKSTTREIKTTTGADIDKAGGLLKSGSMRERVNRNDKGGPL